MFNSKVFLLILVFIFSTNIFSENYYIDGSVSISGNGSLEEPFQTISEGLHEATFGDSLFIREGVYTEALNVSDEKQVVISAYQDELVDIRGNGNGSILDLTGGRYTFIRLVFDHQNSESDAIKINSDENSFIECVVKNGRRDAFDISGGNNNLIQNCEIYNFQWIDNLVRKDAHGIVISSGTGNRFVENVIYDCSGDCIQVIDGDALDTEITDNSLYTTLGAGSENGLDIKSNHGILIDGNIIYGFRRSNGSDGVGVVIHHDVSSLTMTNNEIFDCNGGIRITGDDDDEGTPDGLILERNIIYDIIDEGQFSVDGYGIQFDGVRNIELYNNNLINVAGPLLWIAEKGAENIFLKNNLFFNGDYFHGSVSNFVNSDSDYNGWFNCVEMYVGSNDIIEDDPLLNSDFSLTVDSPCIDTGDPLFGSDFPGGRIDVGAREFDGEVSELKSPIIIDISR